MKKLYEVRAEVIVYVWAESGNGYHARRALEDEVANNGLDIYESTEVKSRGHCLDGGWERDAPVYGADGKILGELLDLLPDEVKR